MKRSLMSILLTVFLLSLFSGCKRITANYPQTKTRQIPPSQRSYPNEVLTMSDFKVTKIKWFEPAVFEAWVAEEKSSVPTYLQVDYENICLNTKPMHVRMSKEIKEKRSAFYATFFWLNSGTNINFQRGGLVLTLRDSQGNITEVNDNGCLFVSVKDMQPVLHDSAKRNVRFNRTFNNKPNYNKKIGNLVCIRIDPQYENWEFVSLKLDSKRISVVQ